MIFPTTYLGPISWYRCWLSDANPSIEQWETFPKQTIRNRCQIAGTNGQQTLTIPVERQHGRNIMTRDIRIVYQDHWQHNHWQAIRSAYRNSPFYDYYQEFFEPFYTKQINYLLDFNIGMQETVLRLLDRQKPIALTTDYMSANEDFVFDNIKPYYQVFIQKNGFIADLSIIDLLFNMGPESYLYL